ncbi:cysteine--tRNA ligase [Schaalia hyovaginalis]|uniref:Cysteine--tRNA ligase n=1 Tax=Schaalia hyovaginalis TaxID=29316 RepID=A0A923E3V1_9ACTO|nr:cysteine--tRNA ligase [Schaalia hyovaginalis]MBB6333897.1 cysteinyl-tRNA synthetase [Schaalia hyovaginalis]
MTLHLHDSKTARLQPLIPVNPGRVGIYLCGATVQGSPHVGHLRAAVSFDTLVRWLLRQGLEVTYVRNVTDIDDKILAKSAEAGADWWAWAYRFEREFTGAYDTLGVLPPTYEPRATGHIPDQIELVRRLIERGHAYDDGCGNVYFDVHSQPDYGSITRQRLVDMRTTEDEAQIDAAVEAGKRDPRDFALWKARKDSEPETASWESPWGRGRPGWHLECSAMSRRYLGDEFDIHGGGIDLRFPHHENEQAQSHGAGWEFARLWVHNAWVTTKGEKMSKSLGNVLSIGALTRDFPAAAVRWALSTVHHRSAIEWGPETLPAAAAAWVKFSGFVERAIDAVGEVPVEDLAVPASELPGGFVSAMDDDLNVAGALAVIHEHLKRGNTAIDEGDAAAVKREQMLVRSMLDVLGLDPASQQWRSGLGAGAGADSSEHEALDALVQALISERAQARASKDWARADELRDRLAAAGIAVADGRDGASWKLA